MKTIALLAVGAFMTAGTAFAAVPTNGNVTTQMVKSNKSTGVIIAAGKSRGGSTTSSGSGLASGRSVFGS